jgi:PIN domain nuclease of toxin-antitoxin system
VGPDRLILDTCALLWLASGERRRLSENTFAAIDRAETVSVVAITGFEIGIKYMAGKLRLPVAPRQWFDAILGHHRLDLIDLDLKTCVHATQLPPIHKDPCDRLIIAAALIHDLPVVTADVRFTEYGVRVMG